MPLAGEEWANCRGGMPDLRDPAQLVGRKGESFLFRHNGLHIEVVVDRTSAIGSTDLAGISDVILKSALTTLVDPEYAIAAVAA